MVRESTSPNGRTILVVDDEPELLASLKVILGANGFDVETATNGRDALAACTRVMPDLVLIDLVMPVMDGMEFIRHFRAISAEIPIIVVSVQGQDQRKVMALDLGADDYVTKPFVLSELLARIRSNLRRISTVRRKPTPMLIDDLMIDLDSRRITRSGETIHLTPTEFNLLACLASNEGKVVTHRHLLATVWGEGYLDETPSLRVMIRQLRKKLEQDPDRPKLILTEPGVGYRFDSSTDSPLS